MAVMDSTATVMDTAATDLAVMAGDSVVRIVQATCHRGIG